MLICSLPVYLWNSRDRPKASLKISERWHASMNRSSAARHTLNNSNSVNSHNCSDLTTMHQCVYLPRAPAQSPWWLLDALNFVVYAAEISTYLFSENNLGLCWKSLVRDVKGTHRMTGLKGVSVPCIRLHRPEMQAYLVTVQPVKMAR